ncbi:Type I Iterative PKS [Bacidia gigantensis]|uniref:Type I Iterative PKS n=1 Tax=Bacidia gigantensis TaxID=2732470 RepID=UPI001D03D355|nr:Type I Iterative PKS [Bacidia gigantensis]KAG8528338.1 Type I Iterative PKS [Bacidia gigantensis]
MTVSNSLSRVLVFPPEHTDVSQALHELSVRSKARPQLSTFLASSSAVVHELLSTLEPSEQESVGSFEDLLELSERHVSQQRHNAVVELVLTTTIQLGQLLVLAEEDPLILSEIAVPTGFGIGLVAAAVATTASDANSVAILGLEGVAFAFRLAVELQRVSRDIEESNDNDDPWARVVSSYPEKLGLQEVQQSLNKVNAAHRPLHHAYIGQVLSDSLVIMGPPSTLTTLAKTTSDFSLSLPSTSTPSKCLLYGSHLPPVEPIRESCLSAVHAACATRRPLYSGHSPTTALSAETYGELLYLAAIEIAHKSMDVMESYRTVASTLQKTGNSKVVLTTVGSSWEVSAFQDILQQHDQCVSIDDITPSPRPFSDDLSSNSSDAIAVVGMSGRFPDSDTLDELWRLLETGTTTHQEIPSSRFNMDDFYDPSRAKHNALVQRYGCFIKKPGQFDHRLFNISPREALQMDPVQRMLLMTTYEALEMAGYSDGDEQAAPRIATYFGQTVDDWKTIQEQQGIDTHFLPAVNRGFAPGRLCHYFKWAGGFYSIDTGCSSSATSICIARDALAKGDIDAAVVGGGTLLTAPEWFSGLGQGGFLSPTGSCKTYSDKADGYCRGEGVAVVVLKRLSDAIRAKDNVLAVIAGAARNTNAGEGSITHPGAKAQETLYRRVLRQAAVRPNEVDVIEMHGTGTQAGDRVETTAVQNVFASPAGPKRSQPLIVGAIKANVGHSEAAAGVVSLIKAILMLHRDTIPPQPNQPFTLNPYLVSILGPGTDVQIANGQAWPRNGAKPRYVFVNNFDAAGGNVSVLIHEAPPSAQVPLLPRVDSRSHHIIATSGRTEAAQTQNKDRLRKYLQQNPETSLASLAYTTTARRMHHNLRDAYVATSVAELLQQLGQPSKPLTPASSVVFTFTGQGSQYAGMGGTLYRTSSSFRRMLDSYQRLCDVQGLDCHFLDMIIGSEDAATNTMSTACEMQVATVALEIALARYWQSLGLTPTLLVGHSLGEYAALCVAGVFSVGEALALAYARGKLITSRCPPSEAGMLYVGLPVNIVRWRIRDLPATSSACEVCCINGPSSTVVGGPVAALDALENYLNREPVAFHDAIIASEAEGLIQDQSFVVEIGPHPTCINFVSSALQTLPLTCSPSLRRGHDDWKSMSQTLAAAYRAQLPVSWTSFYKDHLDQVHLLNDLPTYAFDCQEFWVTYKTPAVSQISGDVKSNDSPSRLSSTSLSSVDELRQEGSKLHAVFKADLTDRHLAEAIGGHVVDGVAICPASIFIDMAYTAAEYLETTSREISEASLATYELVSLSMTNPLVLRKDMTPDELPKVFLEVALDQSTNNVSVRVLSRAAGTNASPLEHGSCVIRLDQSEAPCNQAWSRLQPLVQARIQTLEASSRPKQVHSMDKQLFYKVFSEIVDYASPYHAVEEATVAANFRDAAFVFSLPSVQDLGKFTCSPFAVDAAVHVAGFLLNADVRKPKNDVHIANHIGSLRVLGDLSSHGPWTAYATIREQNAKTGTSLCDVYVTDTQDKLVILCTDICFKKLDRDFFSLLTGAASRRTPKTSTPPSAKRTPQMVTPPEWSDDSSAASSMTSSPSLSSQSEPDDLAAELLSLVSLRSGVSMGDLEKAANTTFTDFGVDSQMSIQILADFHKTTAVELPAAFFSNFPTPISVHKELNIQKLEDLEPKPKRKPSPPPKMRSANQNKNASPQQPSKQLFAIVADALGLEANAFTPSATFESLGMDSMLSIKTLSEFQQKTQIELPAAFFTQCSTVAAAQKELDGPMEKPVKSVFAATKSSVAVKPTAKKNSSSPRQQKLDNSVSRSVLIQGQSRSQASPLFMTTDGSGTVESYIHLSALPEGRRIYALESPFLGDPDHFDLSIQEMATIFIRTIRRIQPHGPYMIGGWSAGSVYAYEVANRLAHEGEDILSLLIIDMRAPSLIPTAIVTPDFVDKLGTFEGINRARDLPADLSVKEKSHLMATCRALSRYDAPQFPTGRQPRNSVVIWARLGLDQREDAGPAAMCRPGIEIGKKLEEMDLKDFERYFNSWFYGKRSTFGTNGWEDLLGDEIAVHQVDGGEFSLPSRLAFYFV